METRYSWLRLAISLLIASIGGVGLWSVVVVLPIVQDEFGVLRAGAAFPYTALMIGFAIGGIMLGRLADRFGVTVPLSIGGVALGLGYVAASYATTLWQFALAHGILIGMLGSSATFGPLIADISRWFTKNRGIAVAICSCGSYLGGSVWPPVLQHFIVQDGWRTTHFWLGIFCMATIVPLAQLLRRRAEGGAATAPVQTASAVDRPAIPRPALQAILVLAGLCCCIAMAMPQVHIVALCVDLGYGTERGVQMLSLMLATGIVSRLGFGMLADRIGALPTLLVSSGLQALSLLLFLPFDGLAPLFLVSALFGLSQGGIVPTYALIVRDHFPAAEAGARIGLVLSATLVGMAIGGWMSGAIYDATFSYELAFLNGFAWNAVNVAIAVFLILRLGPGRRALQPA